MYSEKQSNQEKAEKDEKKTQNKQKTGKWCILSQSY